MSTRNQHGWGRCCKVTVDKDVLRDVTYTIKPCNFSEVLKRAKQTLAQGNGTKTRIPNWISENPDYDHKQEDERCHA